MEDNARIIQLLEENLVVAKETQERLLRMERLNRFSFWAKVVLWVVVLVVPLLLIGPFLGTIERFLTGGADAPSVGGLPSPNAVKDALDLYRTGEL